MANYDFSKLSEVKKYFNKLLPKIKDKKIKAIYLNNAFTSHNDTYYIFMDTPAYIIFENGDCLVLEYYFIDELNIEYRTMTIDEENNFIEDPRKDYFNYAIDIYNPNISSNPISNLKVKLSYGSIVDVHLKRVTKEYSKWRNGDVEFVLPTEETFNEIKFIMDNGKSFVIKAEDAEMDGYVKIYSNEIKVEENSLI